MCKRGEMPNFFASKYMRFFMLLLNSNHAFYTEKTSSINKYFQTSSFPVPGVIIEFGVMSINDFDTMVLFHSYLNVV